MRVGVVTSLRSPNQGGGFTAQDCILDAIQAAQGPHEFVNLNPQSTRGEACNGGGYEGISSKVKAVAPPILRKFLSSVRRSVRRPSRTPTLEDRIRDAQVDIVWFLFQGHQQISTPYITTVWDLVHRRQPVFLEVPWDQREASHRHLLPRATRVISGTASGKADIVSFYGVDPENVVVVPLPVHPNIANGRKDIDVRKKYGIMGDYIFYPAHFWRIKNHVNLLLAIDRLRRRDDCHLKLVLAGSDKGNREHVLNVATELDLLQDLHILDFVPQEELGSLYREAVALVYPCFNGPDNLPPLEAFSVGCPVAAAAIRGANEQLEDAALWFDATNPDEIARSIVSIVSDKHLRAQLIRRGYEVVSRRSPDQYVARIFQLLNELEPVFRCWRRSYVGPSGLPIGAGQQPVRPFDAKSARVARPESAT